ncbi:MULTISPECIES: hypothetical protein [Rhodococcus]|uniref:hypothetical protein n=1 Tax=Rhodococcus TaxID=1827 RepID=UPI001356E511|nr:MULTISPECIES: hypothetical protein [Rhodococcus]KAF0964929.1 hypothetical protein MLGJGCBP_01923 [Rhodococcus sp. T7]UOT08311.1 hypothetical protein MPY17_39065 [Rhodococcus opacus]
MNALFYIGLALIIVVAVLTTPSLRLLHSGAFMNWVAALALAGCATMLLSALTSTDATVIQRGSVTIAALLSAVILVVTVALVTRKSALPESMETDR